MAALNFLLVCLLASFLILETFGYRSVCVSCLRSRSIVKTAYLNRGLFCTESSEDVTTDKEDEKDFQIWTNPKYSEEQINKWYLGIDRALVTVGSKGIATGQVNSILDLLQQHVHIRVKVSSDKFNSHLLSKEIADNELLAGKAELLQVRKRGFMFGTLEDAAAKNTAIRAAKQKVIDSKDVSKIKCYNCDGLGHYSSDCPEPKKIETKTYAKQAFKKKY